MVRQIRSTRSCFGLISRTEEYEPERYDRAEADYKAGRRGPGVVNGYDLFYGSECEDSDDDDW